MSKNPAVQYILATKKLNLVPTKITGCPLSRVSVFVAGTKLSPICSPKNVRRTYSKVMEPRFQRDKKKPKNKNSSNSKTRNFCNKGRQHMILNSRHLCAAILDGKCVIARKLIFVENTE